MGSSKGQQRFPPRGEDTNALFFTGTVDVVTPTIDKTYPSPAKRPVLTWQRDSEAPSYASQQMLFALDEPLTGPTEPPAEWSAVYANPADFWQNAELFELDTFLPESATNSRSAAHLPPPNKRSFDSFADVIDNDTPAWFPSVFPTLFPAVPSVSQRSVDLTLPNPFLDLADERHVTLSNRMKLKLPKDGAVDGYIKIRFRSSESGSGNKESARLLAQPQYGVHHGKRRLPFNNEGEVIRPLPPHFATQLKLDAADGKVMKFYLNAWCNGRTLLKYNFWYHDVAPMASGSECVKHALLSFTTAYVLDYSPTEQLRARANFHYKRAVELLGEELANPNSHEVGQDDAIVAALVFLLSDDIVNWESRKARDGQPLWRLGARTARQILDHADPGYRYWKPTNVQSSSARIGNANWIAYVDICAQPVTPLHVENTEKLYSWLLEGSERDVLEIQGVTGVSPKLLHTFAQITHLAARLHRSPDSAVLPHGAHKIERRLKAFRQWSTLDETGYVSEETLFASCHPHEDGKVYCPARITELSAHAWVPAALIYLQCRFFRKPRSHPSVQTSLNSLLHCIQLLPCTGKLFTSQSPFFPVFIMAVVSCEVAHRNQVCEWFDTVLGGASCRSSVPPVWRSVQSLWKWLDEEFADELFDESSPISERRPWWEEMVAKLNEEGQVLSLV